MNPRVPPYPRNESEWRLLRVATGRGRCGGALALLLGILAAWMPALADPGWYLPYQTRVTDATGAPTTAETLDFTFRLIADGNPATPACDAGSELWSETHTAVPVVEGAISVLLGATSTLPGLDVGVPLCLDVEADDGVVQVFDRRQRLAASFFAWDSDLSDDATTLQGKEPAYFALAGPHQADLDDLQDTIDGSGDPQQSFASRIAALQAAIGAMPPFPPEAGRGTCNGRIRTNPASASLEPYDSRRLVVEVGGALLGQDGSLDFEWPGDLKSGDSSSVSAPGRFVYLYVAENPVGVMAPLLSTDPPGSDRSHPDAAYPYPTRYVGEIFVDPGGAVVPVRHDPKTGEYRFLTVPVGEQSVDIAAADGIQDVVGTDVYLDLESVLATPVVPLSALVPATASAAQVSVRLLGRAGDLPELLVSDGRLIGAPWSGTYRFPNRGRALPGLALFVDGSPSSIENASVERAWVAIDGATPRIAVAGVFTDVDGLTDATLAVTGWRSLR